MDSRKSGYEGTEALATAAVEAMGTLGYEEAAPWLSGELKADTTSPEYGAAVVRALVEIREPSGLHAARRYVDAKAVDPVFASQYADLIAEVRQLTGE
jgi:hypothetical protein